MRRLLIIFVAALAAAALGTACFAQATTPAPGPDAYVTGDGVIEVPSPSASILPPNAGILHVNVIKVGARLLGGFSYREVRPNGQVVDTIATRLVKTADIKGNSAEITAEGYYNRTPACLRLEVIDDPGSGDWYRISANGCMLTVIYYDAAGGVKKGDIRVWTKPVPPPPVRARGAGAIRIPLSITNAFNIGSFRFSAESTAAGPQGGISFAVVDPRIMAPINRPLVSVFVPSLNRFDVARNKAYLAGFGDYKVGTLVRKVAVQVVGIDNRKPVEVGPAIQPDWFSIKVFDPVAATVTPIYQAEGYLVQGDIMVGPAAVTAL